jgi:hypothetical protein
MAQWYVSSTYDPEGSDTHTDTKTFSSQVEAKAAVYDLISVMGVISYSRTRVYETWHVIPEIGRPYYAFIFGSAF